MRLLKLGAAAGVIVGLAAAVRKFAASQSPRPPQPRARSQVDEAGMESFPASDPPGWTLGVDPEV